MNNKLGKIMVSKKHKKNVITQSDIVYFYFAPKFISMALFWSFGLGSYIKWVCLQGWQLSNLQIIGLVLVSLFMFFVLICAFIGLKKNFTMKFAQVSGTKVEKLSNCEIFSQRFSVFLLYNLFSLFSTYLQLKDMHISFIKCRQEERDEVIFLLKVHMAIVFLDLFSISLFVISFWFSKSNTSVSLLNAFEEISECIFRTKQHPILLIIFVLPVILEVITFCLFLAIDSFKYKNELRALQAESAKNCQKLKEI